MNNKFKKYLIIWALLFAMFNFICFITPNKMFGMNKFGGAFWSSYIFIFISFLGQLYCAYLALKENNLTKLFYNIPIIRISYTGLVLSTIIGTLCMAIPNMPNWLGAIVCMIIVVFTAIAVVTAKTSSDIVSNIDEKIKSKTAFIKIIIVDADVLCDSTKTLKSNSICKKVYEAFRFSDPMSSDELTDIENEIKMKFEEFSKLAQDESKEFEKSGKELLLLIENRNKKCKLLK